jgi:ABC-type branched-subunit amino acid transport system substrate-binding protein
VISASASPNDLTSVFYIWRAAYVDGQASRVLGNHLLERTSFKRAFVLHDDIASMQAEAEEFGRAFSAPGRSVANQLVGSEQLAQKMTAARTSGADVLYAAYSGDNGFAAHPGVPGQWADHPALRAGRTDREPQPRQAGRTAAAAECRATSRP